MLVLLVDREGRIAAVGVELFVLLTLLVLNGVLAMSELAVVSSRRARLQELADEGNAGARAALNLIESPNRFLSTVQIGITLVGIFAGAFGGVTLARYIQSPLAEIPAVSRYSEEIALATVVGSITYLSLVIGELVPKRIALRDPERVASLIARPMSMLSVVAAPFVRLLSLSTEAILALLGLRSREERPVTEEEIKILVEHGTRAGVFLPDEQELVLSVFRLGDRHVHDLATPRTRVVWLDIADPLETLRATALGSPHLYFPLCHENLDEVVGVVSVKDLWSPDVNDIDSLRAHARPPLFVPENVAVLTAVQQLRETGTHMALVVDEYGGVFGLFTVNDVLESLVGYIAEHPADRGPIVQREDKSWLVDGLTSIDVFEEALNVIIPRAEEGDYDTIGGMVMARLGRIPAEGDSFEWAGLKFEVIDMDGHRVDKVLVRALQAEHDVSK